MYLYGLEGTLKAGVCYMEVNMTPLVPAVKVHLISWGESESNLIQFLLRSVDMGQGI